MSRKGKILALVLSIVMALSLIACGGDTPDASQAQSSEGVAETSGEKSDSDTHIAVIFKTLSAEYWKTMEAGAKDAAKDLGIEVTVLGPNAESEIAQQVTQIEEQLSAGVDAIVVSPNEENAIIGALSPAIGKIPVLFVDTDAGLEGKTAFIGTGNTTAAQLGGKYVAEHIPEGKGAILIGGQQGEMTSAQRLDGYRESLEAGGVQILEEQFGKNTADGAMAVMEDLITKYQDEIGAVLSHNDDMAIGIQQALESAGLDDVIIIGFNADAGAVQLVSEGKITATIAQKPYQMGYQCVEEAYKAAKGEEVEAYQEVPAELVTSDNVSEYLK